MTVKYYIDLAAKGPDPVIEDESVLTKDDRLAGPAYGRNNAEAATKIIKGGSWYAQKVSAKATNHSESQRPDGGMGMSGFRIVVENIAP
jgi:hypothetical protein